MLRTDRFLVMLALAALVVVANTPGRARVATPTPSPSPTIPPATVVSAACINPTTDMTLKKWAYVNGYLECETVDNAGAEGNAVYQESPIGSGTFTLLIGVGGLLYPSTMVRHGVPSDTATALYTALASQT